ncbi:MBL fold metallo-hydrolase [Nannocystis sp. ILAH1]|uniref:MBL fold metallo-hydrolase n=1 Tax=Nannocystis sp. ILAH1 TaxID=2996789 RepID=UPI002270B57D|nr:MBL fold metallo-hydrolase [Nannocystis sp. ILAH1]MCY0985763.1 MBL fold metallo-hydrolase [Nannocystis sp. ILAH1]
MIFRPFYTYETGCAGYLLGCGGLGKCAVVDAHERDIDAHIAFAADKGMQITYVIDTHVHADHHSGGPALAARVGAKYCLHASADVDLAFTPLHDGQEIELGNTRVRVLHTPGHTPESVCLVVTDLRRGPDPWFVLTGDTLFVGAVGRPDLPGRVQESAGELFESIHQKLLTLPGELEVYPAHFAGSACGAGISGKPSTTIAFECRFNPLLALGREAFVAAVAEVPPKPAEIDAILRTNRGRSQAVAS